MDRWHAILRLFNTISVISEQCESRNVKLCAMEPHLWLGRFLLPAGLEPGTDGPADESFTY